MSKKNLQLQQLNAKMLQFSSLKNVTIPPGGWIKAIRTALGISLQQLGNKLSVSRQNVLGIERREKEGAITINTLHEIANAMDMKLVYGFVPKDGSLDALIERRARELAIEIVKRTSVNMKLEAQSNSKRRIEKAIKERTAKIISEKPKMLWD